MLILKKIYNEHFDFYIIALKKIIIINGEDENLQAILFTKNFKEEKICFVCIKWQWSNNNLGRS